MFMKDLLYDNDALQQFDEEFEFRVPSRSFKKEYGTEVC